MNNFTNQPASNWAKQHLLKQVEVKTGMSQSIAWLAVLILLVVLPILVGLVAMIAWARIGIVGIIFGAAMLFMFGLIFLVTFFSAKKNVTVFNANGVVTKNNKEFRWENLYYVNYKSQNQVHGVHGQGLLPMLLSMLTIYLIRAAMTAGKPRAKAFQGIELVFADGKAFVPSNLKNFDEVWDLVEKIPAQPRINGVYDASTIDALRKAGVYQLQNIPTPNLAAPQNYQPNPVPVAAQTPPNYQPAQMTSPPNYQPTSHVSVRQPPPQKSNLGLWIGLSATAVVLLGLIFGGLFIVYRISAANSFAKTSQPASTNSNSSDTKTRTTDSPTSNNKDTRVISKDDKADLVYTAEEFYAQAEKGADKKHVGKIVDISGRLYPLTTYFNLKASGNDSMSIGISEASRSEIDKLKEDERVTLKCLGTDSFPKLQNCVFLQSKGIVSAEDTPELTFTAEDYYNKYGLKGNMEAKMKEGDKIKGKIIDITGKAKVIGGIGEQLAIGTNDWVTCYADPENKELFRKLTNGQEVKFRGISNGDHLKHCIILQ